MKKLFYIPLIFISLALVSFTTKPKVTSLDATSKEELKNAYEKAIAWFSNNSNCKVNIKYSSFTDHTTTKAYDQSVGFYERDKNNVHVSSMGITTIQNEKICLVVDSVNQIIVLKNKTELSTAPVDSKNLSELLDNVKSLKKQNIAEGGTLYQLEFKPNELYSSFEFKLNKNGLFSSITYYYSKERKEDEGDKNSIAGKPRMEIAFSGYESNVKFNYENEFSEKQFIKNISGKVILSDHYKKYELKDYRFKEKK